MEPADTVVVLVLAPKGSNKEARYLKLPKYWSVGRLLDYAASQASILNQNNKRGAKHLCLFDATTGEMLDTAAKVGECDSVMQQGVCVFFLLLCVCVRARALLFFPFRAGMFFLGKLMSPAGAGLVVLEYEEVAASMTEKDLEVVGKAMQIAHGGKKKCSLM